MGISNDLLEKFARGTCTEDERMQVALWLQNSEIPELPVADQEKAFSKERIWNRLAHELKLTQTRKLKHWLAVAATLTMVSGLFMLWQPSEKPLQQFAAQEMELGTQNRVTEIDGMRFTLASDSEAKLRLTKGASGNVVFCGAMEVKNSSGKDVSYNFRSICKNSSYTQKEVVMKAGKTYVVLHNYYKRDEILVLNKDNLAGLPDAVTAQIPQQLSI